jgi:cytochrome oxidase assembly protein ShyY1
VLVNRGWIAQMFALRKNRPASIDPATTIIKGLSLRSPQRRGLIVVRAPTGTSLFTPKNNFAHGKFYSVNVPEMAEYTGSQPLLIEQTFGIIPVLLLGMVQLIMELKAFFY